MTLRLSRERVVMVVRSCFCDETRGAPAPSQTDSYSHCVIATLVLQELIGGWISGTGGHFWLEFADGTQVDATADQYSYVVNRHGASEWTRQQLLSIKPTTKKRYELLLKKTKDALEKENQ